MLVCVITAVAGTAFAAPAATPPPQKSPAKAPPSVADKTTGLERHDGLLPLYWDANAGALYLEIPAATLGKDLLYLAGTATGLGSTPLGVDRAESTAEYVVRFERVGPKVLLTAQSSAFVARTANAAERADVDDSFARSTLFGFTVAAADANGRVLVDATDFVTRDSSEIAQRLQPAAYHVDASRSAPYLPRTKAFPNNTELEATITLTRDAAPDHEPGAPEGTPGDVAPTASALTLREHQSFVQLPDGNYTPRPYDPRAGMFDLEVVDFAAPLGASPHVRYAVRHRVTPKQPLVYYVDRGMPDDIRRAVLEGAAWWRDAFEAAGLHDAFRVELLPDGADPMDVRYNVIDWVHRNTRGWSYGSFIDDPRTGEIIQGHVSLGSLRAQQDMLIVEGLTSPFATGSEQATVAHDLALARVRQLAAHEVGHSLGFRHNFYDSVGGRISVMDYPQPLITLRADGTLDLSQAYATGIGAWDKVAVAAGYGDLATATDARAAIGKLVDDAWGKDLRFFTDEDVDANPRVDRWSNNTDQAAELTRMLAVRDAALAHLGDATLPAGTPMSSLADALVPIYLYHRYSVEAAAHAVGGQIYVYALRGDGKQPTSWVPAADQRAALDALARTLSPVELAVPAAVLARIPPPPAGYDATQEDFAGATGRVFDPLAPATTAAELTIGTLLAPQRAARIAAQHDVDAKLPGLDEVLVRLTAAAFESRATTPYEQAIARVTQRVLVNHLMTLAATSPVEDVRALASHALVAISRRETAAGQPALEAAHREQLRSDIERFVDRPSDAAIRVVPVSPPPPGAPIGSVGDADE